MEVIRRHPVYSSVVVGVVALVAAVLVSTPGDLASAFGLKALAVALAVAVYVVLRRQGPARTDNPDAGQAHASITIDLPS